MDQHTGNRSAVELRIKTLEFKLTVNATQEQQLEQWLETQRRVWNRALGMLKEFEQFAAYNKADKAHAPCCPVPWEYRWQKDGDDWQAIPYSRISAGRERLHCCPIPQVYRQPKLDRDSEYSLTPKFAHKLNQDDPWLLSCPYKLTQGTIKLLATSWAEYRKGKRKPPRFKPFKGKGSMRTLNDTQSGNARVEGDRIRLPKLGWCKVRSLAKRWPQNAVIKSYRIMKEPSGWYILLVGELPCKPAKPSKLGAGFDAGVVHILNDDVGHHVDIPSPLDRRLKKIKRLSRKAASQQKGSANQAKTYALLAKEHEKVRRDRKAWHHKLSTFAVRKYGAIAVEDLNLAGMTRRPKAKPNGDGSYAPNMAAAKAGLNRRILDAGIGGLYSMMEAKAKAEGREFVRVSAAYTSQTCHNCGAVSKQSRLTQSDFVCVHCGHKANADTNAAQNIKLKGFPDKYLALAGESKPVEPPIVGAVKQEGASAPPCSDAATIPRNGRDCLDGSPNSTLKSFNPVAAKTRKRRSAQSSAESNAQLSLWSATGEITGKPL